MKTVTILNGTFTLFAVATDTSGQSVTLGSTTITCDNVNAFKPFGTIDTPTQGELLLAAVLSIGAGF